MSALPQSTHREVPCRVHGLVPPVLMPNNVVVCGRPACGRRIGEWLPGSSVLLIDPEKGAPAPKRGKW